MSELKDITNIRLFYNCIPRGKRKTIMIEHRLDLLDGHIRLTPDQFNHYERKAWEYIDSVGYKNVPTTARLQVNLGQQDGEMIMIRMLSNQQQLLAR